MLCSLRGWPHSVQRCLPPSMIGLDFIGNPPRRCYRTRIASYGVRNRSAGASRCSALGRDDLVLPCVCDQPSHALLCAHDLPVPWLPCVPARSVQHSLDQSPRRTPILERLCFVTPTVQHRGEPPPGSADSITGSACAHIPPPILPVMGGILVLQCFVRCRPGLAQ
jgi:hypothetical protein